MTIISGNDELRGCPFCGSIRVGVGASQDMDENHNYIEDGRRWTVLCTDCGSSSSLYLPSEADAIARWNTRASAAGGVREALEEIAAERERQVNKEGWTTEHDDQHDDESLALVAALYATPMPLYDVQIHTNGIRWVDPWPWHRHETYHRYGDGDPVIRVNDGDKRSAHPRRRRLVVAAALLIAEIERLDRACALSASLVQGVQEEGAVQQSIATKQSTSGAERSETETAVREARPSIPSDDFNCIWLYEDGREVGCLNGPQDDPAVIARGKHWATAACGGDA